jgi:hypothetical protein
VADVVGQCRPVLCRRAWGVGDFPVERKGEGGDLFAFNQTIGIVCSALEQFGFSLGSLLQDRQRARAPPAWAASLWAALP